MGFEIESVKPIFDTAVWYERNVEMHDYHFLSKFSDKNSGIRSGTFAHDLPQIYVTNKVGVKILSTIYPDGFIGMWKLLVSLSSDIWYLSIEFWFLFIDTFPCFKF